jgi:hypothetical protein
MTPQQVEERHSAQASYATNGGKKIKKHFIQYDKNILLIAGLADAGEVQVCAHRAAGWLQHIHMMLIPGAPPV